MCVMADPVVSVVVPLFNKRLYVVDCLKSICTQTFERFEVILVNDGSTDGSVEIARQVSDSRIRVVEQTNRGEGAARNRGIAEAEAGLIAFLDADDTWEPGFLHAILRLHKTYPEAGILATGFRRCNGPDATDRETTLDHSDGGPHKLITDYFDQAVAGDFVNSSSVAVPRWVFRSVGLFLEGEPTGCDREMWARIALRYPVAHNAGIYGRYNVGAEGRVCNEWAKKSKYPPVVRMLKTELKEATAPITYLNSVQHYVDHVLMNYIFGLLYHERRSELKDLLSTESFFTKRFQVEAALLRAGLQLLPLRVIFAMRQKPLNLIRALRSYTL
jgi:glycosyltransferase involved in cell wall biosynthesis